MNGERISSILLDALGDKPALTTGFDGYLMARNARAGDTLGLSIGDWTSPVSSAISIGLRTVAVVGFISPIFLRKSLKEPQRIPD